MPDATVSTNALQDALRDVLLAGVMPTSGQAVSTALDGGFWWGEAPDDDVYPFTIARLLPQMSERKIGRMLIDLELTVVARPRAMQSVANEIADGYDRALQTLTLLAPGVVWCTGWTRREIPQATSQPADREVVQIRHLAHLAAFPSYLTQYAAP